MQGPATEHALRVGAGARTSSQFEIEIHKMVDIN